MVAREGVTMTTMKSTAYVKKTNMLRGAMIGIMCTIFIAVVFIIPWIIGWVEYFKMMIFE
jgi:hypothetical protein